MHDVWSLCISTIWLFNFFLAERTLKQELQGKETSGKGTKGKLTIMPSYTTRLSCISFSSLLFPSIYSSSSSSSFFSSSSTSFSSSFRRFGRPPGPPSSPAGTFRTGTGISAYRPGLLLPPRFQNNERFRIIHRLQSIDRSHRYHKTIMFRLSSS